MSRAAAPHVVPASLLVSGLCLLLVLAFVALGWSQGLSARGAGGLTYPAESAGRMVDRHLSFYAGYEGVPAWERQFHALLFGDPGGVIDDAAATLREVIDYLETHPERAQSWALLNARSRLLVLLSETGEYEALEDALARLPDTPEAWVLVEGLGYAYRWPGAPQTLTPHAISGLRALPLGWAHDHAWLRASERAGYARMVDRFQTRIDARGAEARAAARRFAAATGAILITGLAAALWLALRGAGLRGRAEALDSPWALREGLDVLVRAAALAVLVLVLLGSLGGSLLRSHWLTLWGALFASLPMLWLMHRRLLRPRALGFRRALGLDGAGLGVAGVLAATLVILALEHGGALAIAWGAWQLGLEPHWSEGLPERLIWAPWNSTLLGALNTLAWGPIFEEIGFRGLLYITLRSRLGPLASAFISAGVFAGLHPYSPAAFVAVFWSGLVWALAFERLRSLLPVILAHAGTNAIALMAVLTFYR
jgi:membrane protease YdiL (CAAX protease family)